MKRSVIKTGPSTYSVSLPSSWIKRFNIDKGDELDLEETGSSVVVRRDAPSLRKRVSFHFKKKKHFLKRYVKIMYILGYDELEITCDEPLDIEPFNFILNELSGYEIIDSRPKSYIIKALQNPSAEEFDPVLRRLFRQNIQMAEDCLSAIKDNDKETLKSIIPFQVTNNRLVNLLLRLDNKFNVVQEKNYIYVFINGLENISDDIEDICKHALKKEIKISEITAKLFQRVIDFLKEIHRIYYDFKEEDAWKLSQERIDIFNNMQEYLDSAERDEARIMMLLLKAFDTMHHMEIYLFSKVREK